MRRLSTALSAVLLLAALPSVASAQDRRVSHTATLLPSGDLLIAGGVNEAGTTLASADIIAAPRGGIIVPTGAMGIARASHTATLMSNGCVLAAGGNSAATDVAAPVAEPTARIYDPTTNAWTATGAMTSGRYNHTATSLNDGRVLVCGGQDAAGTALGQCEFYTPTSCTAGAFTLGPVMFGSRYNHTAILLKDGKVWMAGGINPLVVATGGYLPTAIRYNPSSNLFEAASPLIEARAYHTATLMGDGKALVVGGYNGRDVIANTGIIESAEIFDPVSNTVTPAASLSARRHAHAAVLSANGLVDVYGGLGNITTSYANLSGVFKNGSSLTFGAPAGQTAPLTGGTALIDLNFALNKQVVGVIANGEAWLSSPTYKSTWGEINFTPASETVPAVGLRVNLAGFEAGCNAATGLCGKVKTDDKPMSNLQGQAIFYPKEASNLGPANVTAGSLTFAPTPIGCANVNAPLTPASSTFSVTVSIEMDNAFIGKTITSGSLTILTGSISEGQIVGYTATLTSGTAAIPATVVTADATGDGIATFTAAFSNVAGAMSYIGGANPCFTLASPRALPVAGAFAPATLAMAMVYTTNGVKLDGAAFKTDIATVVIRGMVFADHEIYNPKANSWALKPASGLVASNQRYGHSASLLPNNDTIIYGGRACQGAVCATRTANAVTGIQLLYSESNFATALGQTAGQRAFHTTTMLPNGDLLVAGGTNGPNIRQDAEIFNPTTETFVPTAEAMRFVRDLHTATLLPNGRVLIAGGFTTNAASTGSTNTSEIYYPDTKVFIETMPMISSRSNHGAIMLPDGRVFVAGGFGPGDIFTRTAEIFISTTNRWMAAADMPLLCERAIHATVQLKNGHILLIGGSNGNGPLATTADYDPVANTWNCGSVAAMPTALRSHTATVLFDGRVLVAGGNDGFGEADKSFIYDPGANTWTATAAEPLEQPRFNHTATLLPNGNVMITGGSQKFGNVPPAIEIFHINGSSWVAGGVKFAGGPRAFHTMTLALNNKMYGIGGSNGVIGGSGVALYNSVEAGYFTATPDDFSKNAPPSVRRSTITSTSATPFLPGTNLTVNGDQFRGGTEASGGGAASGNSAFSFPHLILQQVDGSGGAASQSNGGFVVDLTTQIFLNPANLATLNTSLTVALPATSAALPYGWYALRTGANDLFSDGKLVQVGPVKPTLAPTGIAGLASGVSSMSWTWSVIAGVDGYNVYNATTGVFLTTIPVSGAPRFDQIGLAIGATTSIIIAGYTLSGDGPLTSSPTSYTLSTTPVNVAIASVTASNLFLSWGANGNSSSATVYEVTQSSDNFVTNFSTPVPSSFSLKITSTSITDLAAGNTYYFRVRAFNLGGAPSPYSATVSTYTLSNTPVGVTIASVTASNLLLYWGTNAASTNTVYEVTQSSDNFVTDVSTPVPALFNLTTNFTTIINLAASTTYYFRVRAFGPVGAPSPYSVSVSTRTRAPVDQPQVSGRTTTSIAWGWTDPGGVNNYRVYNATSGVLLGVPVLNSFTQVGLATNTVHAIKVAAVTSAGEGPLSPSATAFTAAAAPGPFAPLTTITTASIVINWSNNGNPLLTVYKTTVTEFAAGGTVASIKTATTTAFSSGFGAYLPSTLLSYTIVALNGDGLPSNDPPIVFGSTWTLPSAPTLLTTLGTTPTTILVGWSANNNSSSATYQVTYSTDNFTLNIATAMAFSAKFGGISLSIPNLVTGATYSVRVIASNPFNQLSLFSNVITTRTFNGGAPLGSIQGPLLAAAESSIFGSLGNGRQILLRAAAQTFPSDVIVTLSSFAPAGTLCPNAANIGFSIIATPALQPTGSLYLTFGFTPAELGTIPVNRALLLRYEPGSGTCVPLETTVDTVNGQMTARINHFSLFQVGSVPLSTTAETARIFPNPYYTGRDGFLTIDNVPPNARVRILTLRGEPVLDVKANSTGLLTWSGANGFGRAVASGMYLVMVESGGSKKILKLAVIR